jgi:hypothetical protein
MHQMLKRVWDNDVAAIFSMLWVTSAVAVVCTVLVAR